MHIHNELAGEYEVSIANTETKVRKHYCFHNLITDVGLNTFGSSAETMYNNQLRYCQLGSGSSAPLVTDTQLASPLTSKVENDLVRWGSGQTSTSQLTTSPYYVEYGLTYTFSQGSVVGNISEMGVFTDSSALFSRALIKDSNGNPITITVTAIEQVTVKYKIRNYFTSHIAGTGTINITYNSVTTPYNYTLYRNPIPFGDISRAVNPVYGLYYQYKTATPDFVPATSVLTQPSGTVLVNNKEGVTLSPYVQNSFYRDTTIVISPSEANSAKGIKSIGWCISTPGGDTPYYKYHVVFSPNIPKTNTDTLTLVVRVSWGRYG